MKVTTFKLKVIKREISFIFFKNKVKLKTENDANRSWFRLQLYSVAKRQIKLSVQNYKMLQIKYAIKINYSGRKRHQG